MATGAAPAAEPTFDHAAMLAAARMRVLDLAPYLSAVLFRLRPVVDDALGTFAVDAGFRLYYSPTAMAEWGPELTAGVLMHEVGHLLRDHAGRRADIAASPFGWNIAADLEINDDLIAAGVPMPKGVLVPSDFGFADGDFAESYYRQLPAEHQHAPMPSCGAGGAGDGTCGSGADGIARPWELPDDDPSAPALDGAAAEVVRRMVATEAASYAKSRGTVPGGMLRWAENELAPAKLDWRRVLGAAVRRAVAYKAGQVDYSYHKPGRRRIDRVVTPAMRKPIPNVAVVLDTSGSMSQADVAAALSELDGIVRRCGVRGEQLRLLCVDAAASAPVRVNSAADVKIVGGGGTDMRVGIAACEALRPQPDVIVVLTDGYTPWPTERGRARLIVCLIGGDKAATEANTPPGTTVVQVEA
ncbi:MAG TPA: VWA-like domain-containing protein [Acidimicrobiales bacterium]|nr:VWA-like domain-containing protein [Acidimicrobiales bacterium]